MAGDSQPDPEVEGMPWDADDPAETVRLAIGVVAKALGEYGLGMPGQLSAVQAGEALEAASALLSRIAAGLRERAEDELAEADDVGAELLSPSIRRAFAKDCAPASPDGLGRAICDYRMAHVAIPQIGAPLVAWNDPAAGDASPPAAVRDDIGRVLKAAQALRETMAGVSGEAIGRICFAACNAGKAAGFAHAVFDITGELIGYADTALDERGNNFSPGRTVAPKTRLAMALYDLLKSSGVPVVIDGKPSPQWVFAYNLALEANGAGCCPHARKTLQNALKLIGGETMPPAT